jgi:hypothetical protein
MPFIKIMFRIKRVRIGKQENERSLENEKYEHLK